MARTLSAPCRCPLYLAYTLSAPCLRLVYTLSTPCLLAACLLFCTTTPLLKRPEIDSQRGPPGKAGSGDSNITHTGPEKLPLPDGLARKGGPMAGGEWTNIITYGANGRVFAGGRAEKRTVQMGRAFACGRAEKRTVQTAVRVLGCLRPGGRQEKGNSSIIHPSLITPGLIENTCWGYF